MPPSFQIWNLRTGVLDLAHSGTGLAQVSCIHLTADGRRLVTGHNDGTVVVWLVARPGNATQAAFRSLQFEDLEVDFLLKVQPLIVTPRAAKRLTNLYRILRARLSGPERDEFLGPDRGYQAAMIMLALLISSPETAAGLIRRILLDSTSEQEFTELVRAYVAEAREPVSTDVGSRRELTALIRLEQQIRLVINENHAQDEVAIFRRWTPMVARFSFRSDEDT